MGKVRYLRVFVCIAVFFFGTKVFGQKAIEAYTRFNNLLSEAAKLVEKSEPAKAAAIYEQALKIKLGPGYEETYASLQAYLVVLYAQAKKPNQVKSWAVVALSNPAFSSINDIESEDAVKPYLNQTWYSELRKAYDQRLAIREATEARFKQRTTFKQSNNEVVYPPITGLLKQTIANDTLPFVSIDHAPVRIFFRADSYAANHLSDVHESVELAIRRAYALLGISKTKQGINLVLLDQPEEQLPFTGISPKGGEAKPQDHLVFVVYNEKRRPQLKHELFHQLSIDNWGMTTNRMLLEGSAVLADSTCFVPDPINTINAWLYQQQKQFPVSELVGNFSNAALADEAKAYLQAAGIYQYLQNQYGREKLKRFWQLGNDSFAAIYGFGFDQLAQDVTKYYQSLPKVTDLDWELFKTQGCG